MAQKEAIYPKGYMYGQVYGPTISANVELTALALQKSCSAAAYNLVKCSPTPTTQFYKIDGTFI
jgi:hypothetical protein